MYEQILVSPNHKIPKIDCIFSNRELDVLYFLDKGYTNKDIAQVLCINVRTVESHRANAMAKAEVKGRAALLDYYRRKIVVYFDEILKLSDYSLTDFSDAFSINNRSRKSSKTK